MTGGPLLPKMYTKKLMKAHEGNENCDVLSHVEGMQGDLIKDYEVGT